jgi:hypothetical protein
MNGFLSNFFFTRDKCFAGLTRTCGRILVVAEGHEEEEEE